MPPEPFQNALILTGPTGSGKSRLALELAPPLGAEIVSMDSMAIYRRMDIGTAKPTAEERAQVPHHLIDVLEPWESASVAWWLEQARGCCREIESRGRRALIVGGTPLYLKALLQGLFDGPSADRAIRARLEQEALDHEPGYLHGQLAHVDPVSAARLHPNDQRRIIRALEVWELTGQPIGEWQKQWHESAPATPRCVYLDPPRPVLYERINSRVDRMIADGLIDEVRSLRSLERPISREAAQALGYKELFDFLDGAGTLEDAVVKIKTRSRNFAKRQLTWFRHMPGCIPATDQSTIDRWGLTMIQEMR